MPELPEVETTRRGIAPELVGATLTGALIRQPRLRYPVPALLADAAKAGGVVLEQRVQASSFGAMCRLVESRLGITILPEGVLQRHRKTNRLAIVPLSEDWAVRQLVLVVRDRSELSPIAGTLLDHLQDAARQNGG